MRKFVEKIVIGVLSVALVLAVLGLVLSLRVLANAALVILMIAAVAFSVIQIAEYLGKYAGQNQIQGAACLHDCEYNHYACNNSRKHIYVCGKAVLKQKERQKRSFFIV